MTRTFRKQRPKWYQQIKEFFKTKVQKLKATCSGVDREHAVQAAKAKRGSATLPYNDLIHKQGLPSSLVNYYPVPPEGHWGIPKGYDFDRERDPEYRYVTWQEMVRTHPESEPIPNQEMYDQNQSINGGAMGDEITVINPYHEQYQKHFANEFGQTLANSHSSIRVVLPPSGFQQDSGSSDALAVAAVAAVAESKDLPEGKGKSKGKGKAGPTSSKNWVVHTWRRN